MSVSNEDETRESDDESDVDESNEEQSDDDKITGHAGKSTLLILAHNAQLIHKVTRCNSVNANYLVVKIKF